MSRYFSAIIFILFLVLFITPRSFRLEAATFSTAYTTMTNPRFSFLANVAATVTGGTKDVTIKSSGYPDNNTGNLFSNDTVCFNNSGSNGCNSNTTYTVGSVLNNTTFNVTSGITGGLLTDDRVVSTQSGRLSITFTPTDITGISKIRVYIPAATNNNADGIPDTGAFDANSVGADITGAGVLSMTTCGVTNASATYTTTTIGSQKYHNIAVPITGAAVGTPCTFTIGHASTGKDKLINPAPAGTGHTRGVGDKMVITVITEDGSGNIIDKADTGITPNDGVFVSAYIPISVTWTISAVAASQSRCGITTSIATTADNTSGVTVPFGTLYNSDTFFDAAHDHTITTNAGGGYVLQVMENNALKLNGTGTTIPDGNCGGGCSTTVAAAWGTAAAHSGFGYTLAGSDAAFTNPNYKIFDSTGFQNIASRASTGSAVVTNLCYRITIPGTQQAGLYYNNIIYQAYPRF